MTGYSSWFDKMEIENRADPLLDGMQMGRKMKIGQYRKEVVTDSDIGKREDLNK